MARVEEKGLYLMKRYAKPGQRERERERDREREREREKGRGLN